MKDQVKTLLSNLGFEETLVNEIITIGRFKKASVGDTVASADAASREMPLVLSGLLKVIRKDANGQEVLLYYLEGGQTCAMSIACCFDPTNAAFRVVAEEDSTLWMIPINQMEMWIAKYPEFRRFVFLTYQERFNELLNTVDSLVFSKLDDRVYKYLLDKKQASGSYVIEKTHAQIAEDLHTSRVVISRLLKQLEKEGKIEQYRNRIEIL